VTVDGATVSLNDFFCVWLTRGARPSFCTGLG
jgi:hypothetical protein